MINPLIAYNEALLLAGNIPGFIISIYTDVMGQYFMGMLLLTIFSLLYIRTGSLLYGAVIWILVAGGLEAVVPTAGLSIGKLFIVFGIAAGLYSLFTRSKMS